MTHYSYQHYPLWVTLADGSQVIAADAEQEAQILADQPSPYTEGDPRDALRTRAKSLGIEIDGRWSLARLQREIADKTAPNSDQEPSQ